MRIGVIAAEMEGSPTGVGRYLEGMLYGLGQWDHGCEWHLFFQGESPPPSLPVGDWLTPHCSGDTGSRFLWEQIGLVRDFNHHDFDVVLGPSYAVPLAYRGPSAVSIHDLSFEVLPGEFAFRERWRRRFVARRSARTAGRVFVLSQQVAAQMVELYGVGEDEVSVIPLAIDPERFNADPADGDLEILGDLGLTKPFLLLLGSVFERRVPREIVRAFAGLRDLWPDSRLVIAGANRLRRPQDLRRWIADNRLEESVLELGWVDERCVAPLYRGAELAFYLSRYEGYGLPPMECLACGTPVVVSGGLGLDDVWPDYPLRCAEFSAEAIQAVAQRALDEPDLAGDAVAGAASLLPRLSWEKSSRALVDGLRKVAR
jgi:glycosyltransferase involved in cell wall biosynthesis